ncbi:MAG: hypothetical protein Q9216_004391 [Gyalolechia sp. 2 TL-2023]
MAPSVVLDDSSDFKPTSVTKGPAPRTLLLSPPSLSSHPEKLKNVVAAHDRDAIDIQMLDRLVLSLANLPSQTYDIVLILLDADGTRKESQQLLTASVLPTIVKSLKPGGELASQDGEFALTNPGEQRDAIFAGLVVNEKGAFKPSYDATHSVPLHLGRKKEEVTAASMSNAGTGVVLPTSTGKRKSGSAEDSTPAGIGFVLQGDDLDGAGNEEDDDLIDEDDLLSDEDMKSTVVQPVECRPRAGKRRRACKDCSCGLAQRLEAEEKAKRETADEQLAKLKAEELSEIDFTVQGKVGSCGNCALGDAFRCDGCPYIGQPAFKPGEEVKIVNEVQL